MSHCGSAAKVAFDVLQCLTSHAHLPADIVNSNLTKLSDLHAVHNASPPSLPPTHQHQPRARHRQAWCVSLVTSGTVRRAAACLVAMPEQRQADVCQARAVQNCTFLLSYCGSACVLVHACLARTDCLLLSWLFDAPQHPCRTIVSAQSSRCNLSIWGKLLLLELPLMSPAENNMLCISKLRV